jgi:hypothetical protein
MRKLTLLVVLMYSFSFGNDQQPKDQNLTEGQKQAIKSAIEAAEEAKKLKERIQDAERDKDGAR